MVSGVGNSNLVVYENIFKLNNKESIIIHSSKPSHKLPKIILRKRDEQTKKLNSTFYRKY